MSVGSASSKDCSYLFVSLFMFGTRETNRGEKKEREKKRIHSWPVERVGCSNVAINLRPKTFPLFIFSCGFVRRGDRTSTSQLLLVVAILFFFWGGGGFEGIANCIKPNYGADVFGFDRTQEHSLCRSVPRTLWGLFTIFAGIKATLIKITAAKIEKKEKRIILCSRQKGVKLKIIQPSCSPQR